MQQQRHPQQLQQQQPIAHHLHHHASQQNQMPPNQMHSLHNHHPGAHQLPPNTATLRRPPAHQNGGNGTLPPLPQTHMIRPVESIETIPSSNTIDSAMYERDKQIYKCSTMRQGGKFDPKQKPAIMNCPLPEIPKQETEDSLPPPPPPIIKADTNNIKTLHRNFKNPPTGKAIPPPRIIETSPPKVPIGVQQSQPQLPTYETTMNGTHANGKNEANGISSVDVPVTVASNVQQQPLPPPPLPDVIDPMHQDDESNYAVTEL